MSEKLDQESPERRVSTIGIAELVGTAAFSSIAFGAFGIGPHYDLEYTSSHSTTDFAIQAELLCGDKPCTTEELARSLVLFNSAAIEQVPDDAQAIFEDGTFALVWPAETQDDTENHVLVFIGEPASCNGNIITDKDTTHTKYVLPLGVPLSLRPSKIYKSLADRNKRNKEKPKTEKGTVVTAPAEKTELGSLATLVDVTSQESKPLARLKTPKVTLPYGGGLGGSTRVRRPSRSARRHERKSQKRHDDHKKRMDKIRDDLDRDLEKIRNGTYQPVKFKHVRLKSPRLRSYSNRRGPLEYLADGLSSTWDSKLGKGAALAGVLAAATFGYYKMPSHLDTCVVGTNKDTNTYDPNISLEWSCEMGSGSNGSGPETSQANQAEPIILGRNILKFVFEDCETYTTTKDGEDAPRRLNRIETQLVKMLDDTIHRRGQQEVNSTLLDLWQRREAINQHLPPELALSLQKAFEDSYIFGGEN